MTFGGFDPFRQWWRLAGAAGILFIILFIVGIVLSGEPPEVDAPPDEIEEWFTDNGTRYRAGDYIIGLGFVFGFLPFLSGLYGVLSRAEGLSRFWSRLALLAGFGGLLLGGAAGAFWGALAAGLAEQADEPTLRAMMYLDWYAFAALPLILSLLFIAAGVVIVRTAVLWRWLGYVSLLVGVLAAVGALFVLGDPADMPVVLDILGFASFIGWAIWQLLTSVALLLMKAEPVPPAEVV